MECIKKLIFRIFEIVLLAFCVVFFFNQYINAQSNVSGGLMAKNYDEIAFLTTHNAFNNAEENFVYPNQDYSLTRQMVDGVRAFMLDVYEIGAERYEYHSFQALGKKRFVDDLKQIKQFLDNNPNEVITLILECYTTANNIETDLKTAALYDYLYTKKTDTSWPTIAEMIALGKRLVVFSDKNDASISQQWYHYVWKYAVETSFEVNDKNDFSYTFNRGKAENPFFILNHFVVTKTLGVGSRSVAKEANEYSFISERMKGCQTKVSKFPNFVVVDFYNLGDCVQVISEFNGLIYNTLPKADTLNIKLYPVPASDKLNIEISSDFTAPFTLTVFSSSGQKMSQTISWQYKTHIGTSKLDENVYYLQCRDVKGNKSSSVFNIKSTP